MDEIRATPILDEISDVSEGEVEKSMAATRKSDRVNKGKMKADLTNGDYVLEKKRGAPKKKGKFHLI